MEASSTVKEVRHLSYWKLWSSPGPSTSYCSAITVQEAKLPFGRLSRLPSHRSPGTVVWASLRTSPILVPVLKLRYVEYWPNLGPLLIQGAGTIGTFSVAWLVQWFVVSVWMCQTLSDRPARLEVHFLNLPHYFGPNVNHHIPLLSLV